MRYFAILFFLFMCRSNSFSKDGPIIIPVEITFGINHLTENVEIEPGFGFGLSVKRIWYSEKRINLVSGVLFELTKYYDDIVLCGHYCHYKNMKFSTYSFSIPLMLRANAGNKFNFFMEAGPALEIIPLKYGKGIEVLSPPLRPTSETEISGDFAHDLIEFGFNIGVGLSFPINNYRMVIGSTFHSNIQSIIYKQQDELTRYVTLKIGIYFNK